VAEAVQGQTGEGPTNFSWNGYVYATYVFILLNVDLMIIVFATTGLATV